MGRACQIVRPGARGEDAPVCIDLQRVGVDDASALSLCDGERERGFAAGGGTRDQYGFGGVKPRQEIVDPRVHACTFTFAVEAGRVFRHFRRQEKRGQGGRKTP